MLLFQAFNFMMVPFHLNGTISYTLSTLNCKSFPISFDGKQFSPELDINVRKSFNHEFYFLFN